MSKNIISRKKSMYHKAIIVDGLPGCGKTLFSNLVSTIDRVESMTYAFEMEYYCALNFLNRMDVDTSGSLIKMAADLKIYEMMMGRNVNFRSSDLSGITNYHDPALYFKRLFQDGDITIPDRILEEKPILNLTTHNLLSVSEPIWNALGEDCIFVEIVRHPLYMFRQNLLSIEALHGSARHFHVYFDYNGTELPSYVKGWEDLYLKSNTTEKVVHFMDQMISRTNLMRDKIKSYSNVKIITIPFEKFVLNPEQEIEAIAKMVGSKILEKTTIEMKKQRVPRKHVAQGLDIDIYKRCGFVPSIDGLTEREELNLRRSDVLLNADNDTIRVMDRITKEYESLYWHV